MFNALAPARHFEFSHERTRDRGYFSYNVFYKFIVTAAANNFQGVTTRIFRVRVHGAKAKIPKKIAD